MGEKPDTMCIRIVDRGESMESALLCLIPRPAFLVPFRDEEAGPGGVDPAPCK